MTFDLWEESVGPKPKVTVYERPDRGLAVYLRWYEKGRRKERRAEVGTIRDRRGRMRASLQRDAIKEAENKRDELLGIAPPEARVEPRTLEEGVQEAFSVRGPFPMDPKTDPHTRQSKVRALVGVDLLGGPTTLWEELTPGAIRAVWRKIAQQTGGQGGHNKAEKVVGVIFHIAEWLQKEDPDGRYPRPWRGWRGELRDHWKKLGAEIGGKQPRYTYDEVRALWRHRKEADPRLELAMTIGMELRGGQVIRCRRSHLDKNQEGRWVLEVPSVTARKRTPTLTLSPIEAAAVEHALSVGYLSELEAAYQQNIINDYAIFAAGKLREGVVPHVRGQNPMNRRNLLTMIHKLEKLAGVPTVSGRAWHGMRRALSDIWERATDDERLKDIAGGWVEGSEMRRGIYQEKANDKLRGLVSDVRERVREDLEKED